MGKTLGYGEITVANVTEPFTVMLTNEAQQFATDSNRKVTSAQSYYTDIIVIRGSQERTDYTIGNITSGSGITVSKSSKRVTFSVSVGTTIGADTGVIEIPITLDGQTVKKQFSWSCGKQGPQGVQGNDGNSFAWNMLSETNCGKKHWGTESSGGKYSVEDFITEDNINAVKLICTEGISTSNWSYVLFKDIKMLKQLKPSTKYTLSYDIKANRSGAISHSICKGDVSNFCTNTVVVNNIIGNETWQHISVVLTTNDLKTTPTNEILYLGRNALSKVGYSIIKNLKLVEGDINTPWSPSQSDIEGKGVVETIQYYLATSQASGVTSSTSGWSTDITTQKLTADKKYLWNCYQTKYSDGTSEPISTPKIIGVYGDKGQKGDNAKNLSITPSSQYFKSTDGGKTFAPNTITIKPTIQGEISFGKWQYSIDGGVSFVDVVSGQKGLTISNNVLTVSKNSSLYSDAVTMVTFRAVADDNSFYDTCSIAKIYDVSDIQIGGRNLAKKGCIALWDDSATFNDDTFSEDGSVVFSRKSAAANSGVIIDRYVNYEKDEHYIVSFKMRVTSGTVNSFYLWNGKGHTNNSVYVDGIKSGTLHADVSFPTDDQYHQITAYFTATGTTFTEASDIDINHHLILQPIKGTAATYTVQLLNFKIEKGNKATDWTPAPEDVQTAILSTKSEISDVSLKVDKNKQAIEQRVEKTTYEQDLTLVNGDISKANEGLNKWRYEIYPKSLFDSTDQGKSTIDIFAKNKNLTPSRTVLFNDTDLSIQWNSAENYIGYALTFTKFSAAKSVAITFAHDDGAHIYLNGKLIGGSDAYSQTGESLTLGFVKGWNCIEVVVNDKNSYEGFTLGTTISAISECQLMNCYYGTPVARQSHITNQLVENTTNIEGVTTTMQKVMTTVGGSDRIDEFVNNYNKTIESEKQFKKTIGETYTTKDEFNGLEIGGRNLLTKDDCNMSKWQNLYPAHCKVTNNDYSNHIDYVPTDGKWEIIYKKISVEKGKKYVLSFDYKVNKAYNYLSGQKYGVYLSTSVPTNAAPANIITNGQYVIENTVTNIKRGMITFTAPIDTLYIVINGGCIDDNQTGLSFEFNKWKLEKGNKATDWTPAPEDNEINGQNLVSNLPSNWEQGTVTEGSTTGTTYANTKSSSAGSVRPKELIPVSGNITISTAYSNQSKKPIRHWIAAYDVNKNYLGNNYVSNAWNSFPRTLNMKDAKYIAIMVGYTDSSAITPSDISQICLKIERGTSATPFTLAPEDVNGKIVNVETIANQTAKKFEWIVKGGDKSSSMVLTDDFLNIVANKINLKGKVTFESLSSDAKNEIGKVAQSKVDGLEIGGRNLARGTSNEYSTPYTSFTGSANTCFDIGRVYLDNLKVGDTITVHMYIKYDNLIAASGKTIQIWLQGYGNVTLWNGGNFPSTLRPTLSGSGVYEFLYSVVLAKDHVRNEYWNCGIRTDYIQSGSVQVKSFKVEKGSKATDWTPAPEDYLPQVDLVSNWTTNTTWIDGGKIYTNSITADKIATDAIKSRNYISSGGTQGSFLNLNDGSFTSPNLSWDSNGNLIAKNANLSGEITATEGSIGKFKITDQWLITGSGSTCAGLGGSDQAFWAGAEGSYSAPFRVGYDGKLTSSNADITGTITATNGKIGRYDITSTYLMTNSGSNASGIGGNQAFWAGAEDSNSAPFRVGYDGVLWAENAAIRGSIETGNLGDEGDTVVIMNGRIGIQGTSNNVEIYSTGFKFGIDGDYYLESVSEGVKCYRNLYATDFIADGWIYNASGGHYTWSGRTDAYISCGSYNNTNNIYYYAGYHAFYVNGDSGSGMMYIETSGVSSRKGFRNSSDERIKQNFSHFDDNFIDTYMNLEPVQYQFKNDTDDKYHFGFKAQQTEQILNAYGQESDKSYGICATHAIDPEKAEKLYDVKDMHEEYTLAYDELIAPTTYMVQHTYKELKSTKEELTKVKQEKADLEARLQAIEAKLGLHERINN